MNCGETRRYSAEANFHVRHALPLLESVVMIAEAMMCCLDINAKTDVVSNASSPPLYTMQLLLIECA